MALGAQIKKYRLFHGWTLEELSERSGVDVGTINALEVRNSKRSEKAIAIASALGLSVEQLLDEAADWRSAAAALIASAGAAYHEAVAQSPPLPASGALIRLPYWPFSMTPERFRSLLNGSDIKSVDDFIRGIMAARKNDRRKRVSAG